VPPNVLFEVPSGAWRVSAGREAPGQDFVAVAELLIAKGADVNARDSSLRTPLHAAAAIHSYWRGTAPLRAPLVKAFIAAGAKLGVQDTRGRTPLHYAAEHADLQAVAALLAAGANPLIDTDRGPANSRIPVEMVSSPDGTPVAELLRKAMAPLLAQAEDEVVKTLMAFLPAVQERQEKTWKAMIVHDPHGDQWDNVSKDYAAGNKPLIAVLGVKTRSGWGVAYVERPPGYQRVNGQTEYILFTLLRRPDKTWGLLDVSRRTGEPADLMSRQLQADRTRRQGIRDAIYDAAGISEGIRVWGSSSGGLPPTRGEVVLTVTKDGHLRLASPEPRLRQAWALEVHEGLAKVWRGGSLTCARKVKCTGDGTTLIAEKGQATWSAGDTRYVMSARGGKVHVEVRAGKDAPAKTLTGERFTVHWKGGLRLVPGEAGKQR
jgi:hypothetical protein